MSGAAEPQGSTQPHGIFGGAVADSGFRRDRALVVAALLLVVAASWAWLLSGAGTMEDMGGMLMPMSSGPWTAGHVAIMLAMWAVMMAAMMLPSATPMVLFYAMITRRQGGPGKPPSSVALFACGYVAVWAAFSVAATGLQFALERLALLSAMMETTSIALAGGVLIAAGLYQWMPLKQACLRRCRSPLEFVLTRWRGGRTGALLMGLRHGSDCLGCCWMLMLLLFVGGVMNLAWIAGLALFILVEKLAPAGHWISRGAGVLLVLWGAATWLVPVFLPRAG
jgi:predicted metal-binding membrane protein